MNMPYALEWEKDALKHLLVAEFEHRKRMALDAIVPVTYLDAAPTRMGGVCWGVRHSRAPAHIDSRK